MRFPAWRFPDSFRHFRHVANQPQIASNNQNIFGKKVVKKQQSSVMKGTKAYKQK